MEADTRKYPRVRGEEFSTSSICLRASEIPPRARGRAMILALPRARAGNTPACAGKSYPCARTCAASRKYPRVRGEESK